MEMVTELGQLPRDRTNSSVMIRGSREPRRIRWIPGMPCIVYESQKLSVIPISALDRASLHMFHAIELK